MEYKDWDKKVIANFDNAANVYDKYSFIQKYFAKKIIGLIKELKIPNGEWFDLGSGTGFLADEIENEFINIKVSRVDLSKNMLSQNKKNSEIILWDLNFDLPPNLKNSTLLISSFCIHWLKTPTNAIKNWYQNLVTGGFLILIFPTNKSFPEWKVTCKENNIEYGGGNFPSSNSIKSLFKEKEILLIKNYSYEETFINIYKLFKSIVNTGAQTTLSKRMTVKELKVMQERWPKNNNEEVTLTWDINIFIIKKI